MKKKILYAVQATGNGHISRAMELLPHLEKYGEVDIFLSGNNSSLTLNAPIKYRSKGLSLYYTCSGKLDHKKFIKSLHPLRLRKDIMGLPVEKYDVVLNDFDVITSLACRIKKVPSVHFGHQASFLSENTPRPENRSAIGEFILQKYVQADVHVGLHFESYAPHISIPVIKEKIRNARPEDLGHITVYLPSYCEAQLSEYLRPFQEEHFEVFSFESKEQHTRGNITFIPVQNEAFSNSMIRCKSIITGAGFETPAEAIHLGKKLLCIPINGQYGH